MRPHVKARAQDAAREKVAPLRKPPKADVKVERVGKRMVAGPSRTAPEVRKVIEGDRGMRGSKPSSFEEARQRLVKARDAHRKQQRRPTPEPTMNKQEAAARRAAVQREEQAKRSQRPQAAKVDPGKKGVFSKSMAPVKAEFEALKSGVDPRWSRGMERARDTVNQQKKADLSANVERRRKDRMGMSERRRVRGTAADRAPSSGSYRTGGGGGPPGDPGRAPGTGPEAVKRVGRQIAAKIPFSKLKQVGKAALRGGSKGRSPRAIIAGAIVGAASQTDMGKKIIGAANAPISGDLKNAASSIKRFGEKVDAWRSPPPRAQKKPMLRRDVTYRTTKRGRGRPGGGR
jgi:hypothetical protein